MTILCKAFNNEKGLLNWFRFLQTLKAGMNKKRKAFIEDVYDFLANQHDVLSPENICSILFIQWLTSTPVKLNWLKLEKCLLSNASKTLSLCFLFLKENL